MLNSFCSQLSLFVFQQESSGFKLNAGFCGFLLSEFFSWKKTLSGNFFLAFQSRSQPYRLPSQSYGHPQSVDEYFS